MNNIVPYDFEPPATTELQGRPPQNERLSLRYIVGVILSRLWPAIGVATLAFLLVIGVVSQIPRMYFAEGALLIQPRRANLTRVQQSDQVLPPDTSAIDTEVEVLRSRAGRSRMPICVKSPCSETKAKSGWRRCSISQRSARERCRTRRSSRMTSSSSTRAKAAESCVAWARSFRSSTCSVRIS